MDGGRYKVKTEVFEGPLDLLLQLITKRKLHISDISLSRVTDDYLEHLEGMKDFPMSEVAHFILVASTLVLIKSRALLPTLSLAEEEEESIEDLQIRLRQYQRIKELSTHVEEHFGKRPMFFRQPPADIKPVFLPTREITTKRLHKAIRAVLQILPTKELVPQVVVKKVISLEKMIDTLSDRIGKTLSVSFKDFTKKTDKINTIVGFLAMLELVKRGIINVKQEKETGEIIMDKR